MKPPPFKYHAPKTITDVVGILSAHDNAIVLAGGQSLMPMLNMRYVFPDHLIDLNRVDELKYIHDAAEMISIGSMTRQREVEFSDVIAMRLPVMREAVLWVGHRQTRNRGTIGGSICNLDPSAEMPAVAMLLDASFVIQSKRQTRELSMAEFASGYMQTALEPDEILTEIRLRPWKAGHGFAFVEFARRHGDFAIVSAGALIETDDDDFVRRIALVVGGATYAPRRITTLENDLIGQKASRKLFYDAAQVCADIEAVSDAHVPSWYRKRLAVSLSQRALEIAWGRAKKRNVA